MAIMAMDMVQKYKVFLVTALLPISTLVYADEWTFEPSLKINETYSDNINFENTNKTSSLVNQTSLGLDSNYVNKDVTYNINAEVINALYSHDSNLNDIYLTLSSDIKVQLWSSGLALIGAASIANQPRSTINNLYSDIVFGDTVQVERYSSGLEYVVSNSTYRINSNLLYETTKSEDGFGDNNNYSASLNSQNGNNSNIVFWDISNNYTERENNNVTRRSYQSEFKLGYITPYKFNPFIRYYDEGNSGNLSSSINAESNSYGFGFRWLAAQRLTMDVSYNFPIDDDSEDEEQQDNYYDVSINWQPTKRTTFNAGVSQRFYGDSYRLNLTHRNRRLTNTISYNESIQVFTRENFNLLIDGNLCSLSDVNVNCFDLYNEALNNNPQLGAPTFVLTEDDSFSLYKTLSWSSILQLSRTRFSLGLSKNERLNFTTNLKTLNQDVDLEVSRKLSPHSNLDFSIAYTETNNFIGFPTEIESRYRYYKVSYNRKLNKTLSFDLYLSHLNRSSDPADFVYKENRISLELKKVL